MSKSLFALFLVSLALLAFVSGVIASVADFAPARYVRDAYRAGTALYAKLTTRHDPLASDLWVQASREQRGVTINGSKAYAGLTLYTSGHAAQAHLISLSGEIVHQWSKPFSEVWDKSSPVRSPMQDPQVYFRKAYPLTGGDLLAIYEGVGDTPWGYGMVRLNKDSRLVWKNLDQFHHDFSIGSDGRIYGLTHSFRHSVLTSALHLKPPLLEDFLVVVSATDGRTLERISLLEALGASPEFVRLLALIPHYTLSDPLHSNAIVLLDESKAAALAAKVPAAAPGQVLLSFRELANGTIALLDLATRRFVWALRGSWYAQHDPDILPNGNLLLFDNLGHFGEGGQSRVIEVDPATGAIVWSYVGSREHPFESVIRGSQERLPNGNTLITESMTGRLLEVTPEGEIAWEFVNPERGGPRNELVPIVNWAYRFAPEALAPELAARAPP